MSTSEQIHLLRTRCILTTPKLQCPLAPTDGAIWTKGERNEVQEQDEGGWKLHLTQGKPVSLCSYGYGLYGQRERKKVHEQVEEGRQQ